MKRCQKCVLPETFPYIEFNTHGVCSICENHDPANHDSMATDRFKTKLNRIIEDAQSEPKQYQALVAYSGGKDSTYLIYRLKEMYDLKILAFTLDNGFMSDASFVNMKRVLKILEVDQVILTPSFSFMKQVFRVSAEHEIYPSHLLRQGSSVCVSCIRMVTNLSLRLACEKNIPMVMLGHSPGQILQSKNELIYKDNKIPYMLRKNLFKQLAERVGMEVYDYLTLDRNLYKRQDFPYTINPFPILGYDEREVYQTIENLGWRRPEDVDPNSSNCRLNAYGILKHKERYQFHPYDYEMSALVRLNVISREEALRRVEDPDENSASLAREVESVLFG